MKKVLLGLDRAGSLGGRRGGRHDPLRRRSDGNALLFGTDEVGFTSRFRAIFTGSGETDGGLAFGGTIRADNAGGISFEDQNGDNVINPNEVFVGGGAAGVAGSVFISGDFGTLTMGDVAGAPEAAVGDVAFTSLTGLGDYNEMVYLSNFDSSRVRPPATTTRSATSAFTCRRTTRTT